MAHIAASLNRFHQPLYFAATNGRVRTLMPPRAATDSPTTVPSGSGPSAGATSSGGTSTSGTSNNAGSNATAPGSNTSGSGPSAVQKLFSSQISSQPSSASTTPAASDQPPTAESVFGPNPWMSNPVGKNPDGSEFSYNPIYFATSQTAAQVAQMVGGTVVASNQFTAPNSPYVQQQPNLMVQMPNGTLINAGLVASFYTHGFPQSMINNMIANEIGAKSFGTQS